MTGRALADYGRLLGVLEAEGSLLASAAHEANAGLAVPYAPGMTLGGTVRHVGSVYRMVLAWLRSGDRPTRWQRAPATGQSAEDYLRTGLRALVGELSAHDPEEGCPTWWPLHPCYLNAGRCSALQGGVKVGGGRVGPSVS